MKQNCVKNVRYLIRRKRANEYLFIYLLTIWIVARFGASEKSIRYPTINQVSAAKAPAEGAVCALIRSASSDCARQLLPFLVSRMAREPLPAALPHALLQRLALHHLVDLIFDPTMIGVSIIGYYLFRIRIDLYLYLRHFKRQ